MTTTTSSEAWLRQLTHLPTAPGREEAVIAWVTRWVGRRGDLRMAADGGGNLLITQVGRKKLPPVLAVAHMDHPAFLVTDVSGREARFEFRGGVRPEYFEDASVVFVTGAGQAGKVTSYAAETGQGTLRHRGPSPGKGDLAVWRFRPGRVTPGRLLAPGCDDLAGCAAALTALDRARRLPDLGHFGVLLTRAEEIGFIGALHAAKRSTIPADSRLLSIEASRSSMETPIGGGPVIRVGDASTVFDHEMTNLVTEGVRRVGIPHQRRLMAGGSCEATAFGAYGYRATGLCLPLGNYHNMGNLDQVETGAGKPWPMLEEIALDDFRSLIELLLVAARAVDGTAGIRQRLDTLYEDHKRVLG